jgi:protein required for attachment to host cells
MRIPANALILVADGRKAMILRNAGDERFPNLKNEWVAADQNPPTSAQGADRPGRTRHQDRRSTFEQTDWHSEREDAFAKRVAEAFESLVRESQARHLMIVAPPRTLAVLRRSMSDDTSRRMIAELSQDLVNLSVGEIETHLDRTETAPQ